MLDRRHLKAEIEVALERSRVVSLVGPRQSGKTTLAHEFLPADAPGYFDLEDPVSATRLSEAKSALAPLQGLVVIDEIQRQPELFPLLRVLADRSPTPAKFLILGSASPHLTKHAAESLAGRIEPIDVVLATSSRQKIKIPTRSHGLPGIPKKARTLKNELAAGSLSARADQNHATHRAEGPE